MYYSVNFARQLLCILGASLFASSSIDANPDQNGVRHHLDVDPLVSMIHYNESPYHNDVDPFLSMIRFNKCPPYAAYHPELQRSENQTDYNPMQDGYDPKLYINGVHPEVYPLHPDDFNPLKALSSNPQNLNLLMPGKALYIKMETLADSVVLGDDFQLREYRDSIFDTYLSSGRTLAEEFADDPITGAKISPVYPGDEGFWEEFAGVVTAQVLRLGIQSEGIVEPRIGRVRKGGKSMASRLNVWPDLWYDRSMVNINPWGEDMPSTDLTLEMIAKSVAGEFSNYHQQTLLKNFTTPGQNVQIAEDIGLSLRSKRDFIGKNVRMSAINAWTFEVVAPVNFYLKWNYGVPRPEEVAWLLRSGAIQNSDFDLALNEIFDVAASVAEPGVDRDNAHGFTAYEAGSPTHPSFPAMHSAGSTCSLWIPTLYDLTPEQYRQTIIMDHAVAYARTVAGVHYQQDNLAGLNAGQRIVREQLPEYLSEQYGYNKELAVKKVNKLSFDWAKVKISEDMIIIETPDGRQVSHAEFLHEAKQMMSES